MESKKSKTVTFKHSEEKDDLPDDIHKNLLENVKQIHGKPKITPATRTEPASEVSEFNIHSKKKTKSGKSTFREADLIRAIKKKKPQIAQKLEAAKKNKTLSRPLETVYEKKAQREAGFQNIKTRLSEWNDVVSSNRVADQLSFPLKSKQIEVYDHTDSDLFSSFGNLTPLEQEFSKVLNSSETSKEDQKKMEQSKFRLTLKEMMEKRKAFAKVKVQASYQIVKARRQNKIKSKKYHRILRREKTKQQLKDFELLQKTDPEAALKQLAQLEKSRAEERATLRHRNTGKWARNQLVKAKYNKESRQAISEQLSKNRELTEKKHTENYDSDSTNSDTDDVSNNPAISDSNNPWLTNTNEYAHFVTGYKKFWEENKTESKNDSKINEKSSEAATDPEEVKFCGEKIDECKESEQPGSTSSTKKKKSRETKIKRKKTESTSVRTKNERYKEIQSRSGTWIVTSIPNSEETLMKNEETDVSDMFNSLEKKLQQKLEVKFKKIQKEKSVATNPNKGNECDRKISNKKKHTEKKKHSVNNVVKIQKKPKVKDENQVQTNETSLETEVPNLIMGGNEELDDEEENIDDQFRMTISEAFVDDDVVAEFQEEKQRVEEEDKPQLLDTSLPGWGSWTDASSIREKDVKKSRHRRTNKRLLFKIPKAPPRKDSNKGLVIIKKGIDNKFKEHMVDELPYPFTKVKDFEAHMRGPIGRTWLPETAHQQLTTPPIVTKLGTVIEPIDEGELVQRENFQ